MNATFRFVLTGALAVGAAVSGLIGELAGVHATLWVGGAFLATAFLPVFLSPVRTRRGTPASAEGVDGQDPAAEVRAADRRAENTLSVSASVVRQLLKAARSPCVPA